MADKRRNPILKDQINNDEVKYLKEKIGLDFYNIIIN